MTHPDWDLLSSYAGLLTLACTSIYAGSFGSLTARKQKPAEGRPETDEDEEEEIPDRLSSSDAYLFPILGSFVLSGLYLVVKFFGKEWINWLLQWYFTFAGVGSVGKSFISLAKWTIGITHWRKYEKSRILVLQGSKEIVSISMRTPSWFLIPLGALPSILYTFGTSTTRRSALLTDMLGLSFSHNALSLLKIDSFKTGCILLSGLFLYDVWWVFGTEVMVKVATTLDVPIKLLWPKSLAFSSERGFTMLGLGDIVVPGMFIALALRYDYYRSSELTTRSFSKPYFYAAMFAYIAGLATTMSVMHFFKAAQPALLYLSPACILSFILTALVRGEIKDAWNWSDEPEKRTADNPDTVTQDEKQKSKKRN
ncbi:signal peptide peptidase-domain-containing protein [Amylocystis lapponica]|nr:signal peptide peptidase-domain-containing protein [Amylocystis lapponica]